MSHLDLLRLERSATIAVLHQFRLSYKKRSKDIYAFFEGNDDHAFYMPELRRRWNKIGMIHSFRCRGKHGVIDVYRKIMEITKNRKRTLFFLDKDLDEFIDIKRPRGRNIFITEYYSLENYIVTDEMLRIACTDFFHMTDNDKRLKYYTDCFQKNYHQFMKRMKSIMGWIIYQKKSRGNLNAGNIDLDNLFKITKEFVVIPKGKKLQCLSNACQVKESHAIWTLVRTVCAILSECEPKEYIRGKFDLWYFVKVLQIIKLEISKKKKGSKKTSIQVQFTLKGAVELFAGRIPYPKTLDTFLGYHLSR